MVFIASFISLFAQKTEVRTVLNTGLFSFVGTGTTNTTSLNTLFTTEAYVENTFGAKNGLCYGLSSDIRRVAKWRFIVGINSGFEVLKSKSAINKVALENNRPFASGKSYTIRHFFNSNPYLGYRFKISKLDIDWLLGCDVAYSFLGQREKNYARTVDGEVITSNFIREKKDKIIDIRLRTQIDLSINRVGVFIAYSRGKVDYTRDYTRQKKIFSSLIRFGLTYKML